MSTRNTKIIAGSTTAIVCLVVVAIFVFLYFLSKERETYEANILSRLVALQQARDIEQLSRIYEDTKSARHVIESQILKDADVITFLSTIEDIARDEGVSLTTKALSEEAGSAPFEFLRTTLFLEGTYESVIRTVSLFEKMPYQIRMDSFNVRKGTDRMWEATLDMVVTKYIAS